MANNRRKTVVFLSASPAVWGAETSLRSLVLAISPDVSVIVLSPVRDLFSERECAEHDIRLVHMLETNTVAFTRAALGISARLPLGGIRFVIFNLSLAPVALVLRFALLMNPRHQVVLDLHDRLTTPHGRLKIWLLSIGVRRSVAISEYVAQQLPRRHRRYLLRPVDGAVLQIVPEANIPYKTVGVIGRIDPDKSLEFAIEVARARPDIRFEFFGLPSTANGEYYRALKSATEADQNIHWMGRARPEEIYASIDLLFISNPYEAMGRTMIEAMIAKRPVVGPASGGSGELLAGAKSAHIYLPLDVKSAAQALDNAASTTRDALQASSLLWAARAAPDSYAQEYLSLIFEEL